MDDVSRYEQALIDWAHRYNGYERIGSAEEFLEPLYERVLRESHRIDEIPSWVGVALLRGLAFYLVRWHRHTDSGAVTIFEQFPVFELIVDAVRGHPAATADDLPPSRHLGG